MNLDDIWYSIAYRYTYDTLKKIDSVLSKEHETSLVNDIIKYSYEDEDLKYSITWEINDSNHGFSYDKDAAILYVNYVFKYDSDDEDGELIDLQEELSSMLKAKIKQDSNKNSFILYVPLTNNEKSKLRNSTIVQYKDYYKFIDELKISNLNGTVSYLRKRKSFIDSNHYKMLLKMIRDIKKLAKDPVYKEIAVGRIPIITIHLPEMDDTYTNSYLGFIIKCDREITTEFIDITEKLLQKYFKSATINDHYDSISVIVKSFTKEEIDKILKKKSFTPLDDAAEFIKTLNVRYHYDVTSRYPSIRVDFNWYDTRDASKRNAQIFETIENYVEPRGMECYWTCAHQDGNSFIVIGNNSSELHEMYPTGMFAKNHIEPGMYFEHD